MTPRLVPAAEQLLRQLEGRKFKATPGEPDGLNRIRSVTFDAATSRWLLPILDAIGDPRIASLRHGSKSRLTVTWVPDYRADFRTYYPLDEVDEVLND